VKAREAFTVTQHIVRDTATLESVWSEYIDILGATDTAALIGKSKSAVYNSANPDCDWTLDKTEHFIVLDRACHRAKGRTPYRAYIDRQLGSAGPDAIEDLNRAALDVGAALGSLQSAVNQAQSAGSPGGSSVTPGEGKQIKQITRNLRCECDDVDRAVDAALGNVKPMQAAE
jgi:hypothetical protein